MFVTRTCGVWQAALDALMCLGPRVLWRREHAQDGPKPAQAAVAGDAPAEDAVQDIDGAYPHFFEGDAEREAIASWEGETVRALPLAFMRWEPFVDDMPRLVETVPAEHRDVALARCKRTDSPKGHLHSSYSIVAIDRRGEALVRHHETEYCLDADGWGLSVMSVGEAIALLRSCQATCRES